jgi:hypothetical protein
MDQLWLEATGLDAQLELFVAQFDLDRAMHAAGAVFLHLLGDGRQGDAGDFADPAFAVAEECEVLEFLGQAHGVLLCGVRC